MRNQFSTEQPNRTRDLINNLLKEISFFGGADKYPTKSNEEVKRYTFECLDFHLQFVRY